MKRPRTTSGYALYAAGAVLGVVGAVIFIVLVVLFALTVATVHRGSFVLCSLGAHQAGCWIRKNVSTPALLELNKLSERVADWKRRNGPKTS